MCPMFRECFQFDVSKHPIELSRMDNLASISKVFKLINHVLKLVQEYEFGMHIFVLTSRGHTYMNLKSNILVLFVNTNPILF